MSPPPIAVRAALVYLLIALPPVLVAQVLSDGSVDWENSNWWVVPVLSAVVIAPFATGVYCGRRAGGRPFMTAALAVTAGNLVILGAAVARIAARDGGIPVVSFVLHAQVTVSIGLVGAFIALSRGARPSNTNAGNH